DRPVRPRRDRLHLDPVLPRSARRAEARRTDRARPDDGRAEGQALARTAASLPPVIVRELELDLDAFEGPFDLLLTLVLRDELAPADVDVAAIVLAFVERLMARDELDLEACGEFLVL